jgi:predicted metal-dependent peptidase
MIVFTDGYVEDPVTWQTPIPSIWVIKEGGRESFVPPNGNKRVVMKA